MNILEKIYQDKLIEVRNRKKLVSTTDICVQIKCGEGVIRNFTSAIEEKLSGSGPAIIAEVKKASPSKGIIRADFDPVQIAKEYEENGAACISVLTDEKYFMGKSEYLSAVKKNTNLPILRKDFIVDPYQIFEAKLMGADCILLIMAMLEEEKILELGRVAKEAGLDVLAEIHDKKELEVALKLDTKLIGVNNRNLKTLKVDTNLSKELVELVPQGRIVICESGIKSKADVKDMQKSGINTFLIGESLMRQDSVGKTLSALF